ncbi:MAG: aminotransferase class I/II-fold pyridoxal phosphate-dependent enzyme [Clostridiales bacterium]|nr:aminotransferase class I/II-fold pyridoxal phosphate-dependent enzyme [Clostridiales bacterium]
MRRYLDEELTEYSRSDYYPFHMPGHKRQKLGDFRPEEIDITEIEGFDNLHHAEGILKEGQERLARLFGADESFYLVNGSTAGLLSAICGCIRNGDRILIGRNCHKAVYHAAYLMEAKVEYLYPEPTEFGIQGSIFPEQVKQKLEEYPDARAVVVTSPTYDGIVSDIRTIADIVHGYGIPLIVDEAHGAHLGFSEGFPQKAIALGADLCVESLHKTLPSYTQTAVLHMIKSSWFDFARVKRYLGIFQSSSPSYVLMAGMDRCVRMVEEDVKRYAGTDIREESLFAQFERRLRRFYGVCEEFRFVEVFPYVPVCVGAAGIFAKDNSKILISADAAGLHGQQLYDLLLEKYHLQMEMASGHYVTALTSIMDTEEGFRRLYEALREIEREASVCAKTDCSGISAAGEPEASSGEESVPEAAGDLNLPVDLTPVHLYRSRESDSAKLTQRPWLGFAKRRYIHETKRSDIAYGDSSLSFIVKRMELAEAMDADRAAVPLAESEGKITGDFVWLYPPGIPILVPGEVITGDVLEILALCRARHMQVQGMQDPGGERIQVVVPKS